MEIKQNELVTESKIQYVYVLSQELEEILVKNKNSGSYSTFFSPIVSYFLC